MENILNKTIDNGIVEEVQISPIGEFTGSDRNGNPIKEIITKDALNQLADKLNSGDDILCDADHSSCKAGAEKNSKAAGWFSKWIVDPIKGLFATLSLTKYGRELLENREYRYTSPVFTLNEDGTVADLHSVALTNVPAFKGHINPIINSEANENLKTKDIFDMTIEELKQLIVDTISEMKDSEKVEEIKEEIKEEIIENEETTETVEETAETETTEETETVANEEVPEVPEVKEDEEKKEEAEVIKLEALNSSPNISITSEPEWKKLKGKEFFDWLAKHPRG